MNKDKLGMPDKTEVTKSGQTDREVYSRLLGYVKPWKWYFLISIIGFMLFAITQVGYAHLIKYFIEALEGGNDALVYYVPIGAVMLAAARAGGGFLGAYYLAKVGLKVVHSLRCEMFDRLICFPLEFFEKNKAGEIINRLTGNVNQVTLAVTSAIRVVVREGFTVIFLFSYLLWSNWKLTLVFLFLAPILFFIASKTAKRLRILSTRVQEMAGEMNQVLGEVINGYSVVKSYGAESYERNRFVDASKYSQNQNLKIQRTNGIATPLIQLFVISGMAIVMYIILSMREATELSTLLAYITAAGLIPKPIRQLSEVYGDLQKSFVAANRIFAYIDAPIEVDTGGINAGTIHGDINISDLSFSYPNDPALVLNDINLTISAGEKVGIVGRSGAGKSTLVNLIPRFYQGYSGAINIDGTESRQFSLVFLRQNISLITQNIVLFNGTVADNIAYGELRDVSRADIERVAELAYAANFIRDLPDGFDTVIGQNGLKLSGGQRQRLSIARALLKDAPILILDEATSSLDVESEYYVQQALESVMRGRTTIVIAHRLSTVKGLDKLFVLENGSLIEEGSHEQLISHGGHYASFYNIELLDNKKNNISADP